MIDLRHAPSPPAIEIGFCELARQAGASVLVGEVAGTASDNLAAAVHRAIHGGDWAVVYDLQTPGFVSFR